MKYNKKTAQKTLESLKWTLSKNPYTIHEYVFRIIERPEIREQLDLLADYIHEKGEYYVWKKKMSIYLILGEYKYWVMWETDTKMTSLNRWKTTGAEVKATQQEIDIYENNS